MAERIFDIHPHIVSKDQARYPHAPLGGKRSDWSKERSVDFEELVAGLDAAGIDKAAIVHSSTTYGFDASYVADSIATNRKRFTGVFSVDVTKPDAPEKMRTWKSRGMDGMRIFVSGTTIDKSWLAIDGEAIAPAWKAAADLAMSVVVNVVAEGEGIGQIANVAKAYPTVPVVIDHLGRRVIDGEPPFAQAKEFFDLGKLPNVYLKLTPYRMDVPPEGKDRLNAYLKQVMGAFGAERIAWGSNFPSTKGNLPDIVAKARETVSIFSPAEREWIFVKTAQKLYPSLRD